MLLEKLKAKQETLAMSDEEFARELNISRPLWQATRTGVMRIGEKVIRGTAKRFPDLQADVLIFLQSDASKATESVS